MGGLQDREMLSELRANPFKPSGAAVGAAIETKRNLFVVPLFEAEQTGEVA